ncbi:MAG: alpha-tubulin suppressor-like RCC1 family protein [Myxococcota bacterium]|jgi:alpha-tubulin suppressor-like RCC1 family protein
MTEDRVCALSAAGSGQCSERGDAPEPLAGGLAFATISAHAKRGCGVTKDGRVACWTTSAHLDLGDGSPNAESANMARLVDGVSGTASVTLGLSHNCAQLKDGTASCWGINDRGQLGDGSPGDQAGAAPVVDLSAATPATRAVPAGRPTGAAN